MRVDPKLTLAFISCTSAVLARSLSVAYGIVRDYGGWIAVKSEVGKGAEFRVYLPYGASS